MDISNGSKWDLNYEWKNTAKRFNWLSNNAASLPPLLSCWKSLCNTLQYYFILNENFNEVDWFLSFQARKNKYWRRDREALTWKFSGAFFFTHIVESIVLYVVLWRWAMVVCFSWKIKENRWHDFLYHRTST